MHDSNRILNFPPLLNARDLGGYPTTDGRRTRWRSLVRADDLVQLSDEGLQALSEYGVASVIDLRWPEEVAQSPHPVPRNRGQIRYRQISLLARDQATWVALRAQCTKEMWKCAVLDLARDELRETLQIIADAEPGPLLFHCVAGKDRTGIIAAVLLALADVEPDAIAYDYAISTENLREAYLQRYSNLTRDEILEAVRCPEAGVHNMLEYLRERGGVKSWLAQIGLNAHTIARLRARLRE